MFIKILVAAYLILTFVALIFIFKYFKLRKLTKHQLKIPDVWTILLIVGFFLFHHRLGNINFLPWYFFFISGLALILLGLDLFYYKSFALRRFLKLFWRISFFITLAFYLLLILLIFGVIHL
ncbi:MAG: DUF3397 domain-containing protein [Streptococcaceae bacterium]|nr:DUF3397 domain-containing protein [Streptococcaceae bacterium]MCL2681425.1 DUF3397 domain-containing protein [Streptococcaceae bacterium]